MQAPAGARRSVAAVLVSAAVTVAALGLAGQALAARPAYPAVFSGTSGHKTYNVEVDSGCQASDPDSCVTPTPNYVYVDVTTSHSVGKCPGNSDFRFPNSTLKHDGSFSVSQAYGNGVTMTVSGRFTSTRSVHGKVSATGCQVSEFTFKLPKPLTTVAPPGKTACYWLEAANASKLLGGVRKPIGVIYGSSYSVTTGLGRCGEWTTKRAATYYGAHSYSIYISQDTPDKTRGFPKNISGLGPGAFIAPDYYSNTLYFKIGSAWATLSFEIPSASKPPASAVAKQGRELLTLAHRIYHLMH